MFVSESRCSLPKVERCYLFGVAGCRNLGDAEDLLAAIKAVIPLVASKKGQGLL